VFRIPSKAREQLRGRDRPVSFYTTEGELAEAWYRPEELSFMGRLVDHPHEATFIHELKVRLDARYIE
jgi:hypothetical protein